MVFGLRMAFSLGDCMFDVAVRFVVGVAEESEVLGRRVERFGRFRPYPARRFVFRRDHAVLFDLECFKSNKSLGISVVGRTFLENSPEIE